MTTTSDSTTPDPMAGIPEPHRTRIEKDASAAADRAARSAFVERAADPVAMGDAARDAYRRAIAAGASAYRAAQPEGAKVPETLTRRACARCGQWYSAGSGTSHIARCVDSTFVGPGRRDPAHNWSDTEAPAETAPKPTPEAILRSMLAEQLTTWSDAEVAFYEAPHGDPVEVEAYDRGTAALKRIRALQEAIGFLRAGRGYHWGSLELRADFEARMAAAFVSPHHT